MIKAIPLRIAEELSVREAQVHAAIKLLDEGATVPGETGWKNLPKANMGYGDTYAIVQTGQGGWLIIRQDPGGFFKWAAACSNSGCAAQWTPIP